MKNSILENYREGDLTTDLISVSKEFKSKLIPHIVKNVVLEKISNPQLIKKITSNLEKLIKNEYNTLSIPYFYILESINLSIEVEQTDVIVRESENTKFGQFKFSDFEKGEIFPKYVVESFSISEKKFLSILEDFTKIYTNNVDISDEVMKIEFN